jgi:4-amino-4-deoxy-L-arabinose transferase-like glycosyltransferase
MQGQFSFRSAILILALGVFTYLYGLDSRFAPKNGDEYPYMHIVRMTADAGHWLPLESTMDGIKNTKPPLVFWQGIASTDWGSNWSLLALRWPSVLYTGLTAFLLFLAVARFSGRQQTGLLAAVVWLSFFSTYRYGRPFLTDPPEVFWMSVPFMGLLYWGKNAFDSKLLFPLLAGACFGMALLSKSFAYIAPATFALGLMYWRWREWSIPKVFIRDSYKLILIAILALGIFGLWFLLDPFPEAVWKEFVLGENAGKFEARSSNYLMDLLRGGDSIWMLALTTLANAGLFLFVLITALLQSWRQRRFIPLEESLLLLLALAFFIVFSLPSQRSGRYLLPIMPALAALIAMHWSSLPLWGFRIALLLQLVVISTLSWVGVHLQLSNLLDQPGIWVYSNWHWLLMCASILLLLAGLLNKRYCKNIALAGCFLTYCALNSSLSPLEGNLGRFDAQTVSGLAQKDLWVPCDYRAKDEEYRLLLPGAHLRGYSAADSAAVARLSSLYPVVAVQLPIGQEIELCQSCTILGKRLEMRGRLTDAQIQGILAGRIRENLFVNEYLISNSAIAALPAEAKDMCR